MDLADKSRKSSRGSAVLRDYYVAMLSYCDLHSSTLVMDFSMIAKIKFIIRP